MITDPTLMVVDDLGLDANLLIAPRSTAPPDTYLSLQPAVGLFDTWLPDPSQPTLSCAIPMFPPQQSRSHHSLVHKVGDLDSVSQLAYWPSYLNDLTQTSSEPNAIQTAASSQIAPKSTSAVNVGMPTVAFVTLPNSDGAAALTRERDVVPQIIHSNDGGHASPCHQLSDVDLDSLFSEISGMVGSSLSTPSEFPSYTSPCRSQTIPATVGPLAMSSTTISEFPLSSNTVAQSPHPHHDIHDIRSYLTEDDRWKAVLARDPIADNHFVYCVKSTRIYCRPTCPSRRPLRKNICMADSPFIAAGWGYRSCRRCRPDMTQGAAEDRQHTAVTQAKARIEMCVALRMPMPNLSDLAKEVSMSKYYFLRTFKKQTGFTPEAYGKFLLALEPT